MATKSAVPPLSVYDDGNDPEYFEIFDGRWIKQESVGRRKHSQLDRIVRSALAPFAQQMGSADERPVSLNWCFDCRAGCKTSSRGCI